MAHLPIQRSHRRFVGPDARKNGTPLKARLKNDQDCEELDLLFTDIPAVVRSGIETYSGNADSQTPMFTETTPFYSINGLYAGVSINSTKMFDQDNRPMSSSRLVPKLVTSMYNGAVTQFNFSNKRWRNGQPLLMGPEYQPEDKKPPRITWYPVESDDLFHSTIAALLATAFGTWYEAWDAMLDSCAEHRPENKDGDQADPPLLDGANSAELRAFLEKQRHFPWTRLSYVVAKIIGTRWDNVADVTHWIDAFYLNEVAAVDVDDSAAATLLEEERRDINRKITTLDINVARFDGKTPTEPYVPTILTNSTRLHLFSLARVGNSDTEKNQLVTDIKKDPIGVLEHVNAQSLKQIHTSARCLMMGIYKRFIVNRLRGQALAVVAPNSYGLVQIT
jgi:hypothetical protein